MRTPLLVERDVVEKRMLEVKPALKREKMQAFRRDFERLTIDSDIASLLLAMLKELREIKELLKNP